MNMVWALKQKFQQYNFQKVLVFISMSSFYLFVSLIPIQASQETHETLHDKDPNFSDKHQNREDKNIKKIFRINEQAKDIWIPHSFFDLIYMNEYGAALSFQRQLGTLLFVPIKVILKEKNPGILIQPEVVFEFPKGGGLVDFSKILTGRRGTFSISFEFEGEMERSSFKVFYVSKSTPRKLDNITYGAGCGKYLDLTEYYTKVNNRRGFVLNTTEERHISTIGGHFLFTYYKNRHYMLTQVTFWDDRLPQLFCAG